MSYWAQKTGVRLLGNGGAQVSALTADNRPSAGVPTRAPEPPFDVRGVEARELWTRFPQGPQWRMVFRTPDFETMMRLRGDASFQRAMSTDAGLQRILNWQKSFLDYAFQVMNGIDWEQEREQWYQLANDTARREAMGGRIDPRELQQAWLIARRDAQAIVENALARAFWLTRPIQLPVQSTIDSQLDQNAVAQGRRIGIAARPPQPVYALGDVDTSRNYAPQQPLPQATFIAVVDDDGEEAVVAPPVVIEQPDRVVEIPPCRIRKCDCPTPEHVQDAWFSHVQSYLLGA